MVYQVLVGNIGSVLTREEAYSEQTARRVFNTYVSASKTGRGRAGGQDVVLMKNGEIVEEFFGSLHDEE